MGDGFWNPADYVFNRYEGGIEQHKGKTLFGNAFTKNYNKIPQEAQDYINEQIQECIDSGYKVTKWFLRALESRVKVRWPDQVPYNWDISSFISTDKGMARAINKQNNSKRVGNTQEQVADAKPGDTVLYNGETVALSENDINKAKQNTGANNPKTGNAMEGDPRFVGKDVSKSSDNAMEGDPRFVGKESTESAPSTQSTQSTQSAQPKMTTDQKEQSTRQSGQAMQEYVKSQQNKNENLKQQSADINQNTIDEINQGSTNVGDIASAVSDVSMPTMNTEARPENLVTDTRLEPVENMFPPEGIEGFKLNKNIKNPIDGGRFGQNLKNLKAWIANRDKHQKGSAEWIRCNDNAKGFAKALIALSEPWETNND